MFILHRPWFFLLLLCLLPKIVCAQLENKWVFGNHAGLDFSSGTPVAFQTAIAGFGEGEASVCDPVTGQLLFYTEGSLV